MAPDPSGRYALIMATSIHLGKKRPGAKVQTWFFVFASADEGKGIDPKGEPVGQFEGRTTAMKYRDEHATRGVIRVGHYDPKTGRPVCL